MPYNEPLIWTYGDPDSWAVHIHAWCILILIMLVSVCVIGSAISIGPERPQH